MFKGKWKFFIEGQFIKEDLLHKEVGVPTENLGELKHTSQDERVTTRPRAWPAQIEREKGLVSLRGRRQG